MTRKLQKSLKEFDRSLAKEEDIILGDLGVTRDGQRYVNVPNRFPFVYVRLRSSTSELIQAFNDKVSPSYDLPVRLKREGGRYIVLGRYGERYSDWSNDNPYLSKHSDSHVFDKEGGNVGDDPVWVFPYQFMPSLVSPFSSSGAQNVFINPWLYYGENGWNYLGNTGTPGLLSSKPAGSGTTLILISHEVESGNPTLVYATGTPYIPESYTGSAQLYPYIPSPTNDTDLPLAFIRLVSGTSSITWNNIYDARQYFGGGTTTLSPSTGTSNGGIDGIVFQDEGIVQGTGTVINFVGDNVSVSISGTVARVYVTGSSGGGLTLGTASNQAASGTHTHGADEISIVDSGNYFTGTSVESALQEAGAREIVFITDSNEFYRGASLTFVEFTATINGTPSGTMVGYNAPSAGNESDLAQYDGLGVQTSNNLTAIVLHNTTRGNSALISDVNLGTNVITLTSNAPLDWASGDTITTSAGLGSRFRAVEIKDTSVIPDGASHLLLFVQILDTAGSIQAWMQSYETFSAPKTWVIGQTSAANSFITSFVTLPLITRRILLQPRSPAGATSLIVVRVIGYKRGQS